MSTTLEASVEHLSTDVNVSLTTQPVTDGILLTNGLPESVVDLRVTKISTIQVLDENREFQESTCGYLFVSENIGNSTYYENSTEYGITTDLWNKTLVSDEKVYLISAALFVIIATIFGNILVIVAVVAEKRLRKVGNTFIVSLAVSDLLVGLVVTPVALLYHLSEVWSFGMVFCDIWVSLDVICCTASIINLCVISFDRYNAITRPLRYALKRTPKRATAMIFLVWSYSVLIAVPPLIGWREYRPPHDVRFCAVSEDIGYTIFSTVGAFYAPLIVMLVMYAKIFNATLKRKQNWLPGPRSAISRKGGQRRKHEFAVLINATDSVRRHYQNTKYGTPEPPPRTPKSPNINPRIGYRLMKSGTDGAGRVGASLESIPDCESESPGLTPQPSPRPSIRTEATDIPQLSMTSATGLTLPLSTVPNGGSTEESITKNQLKRTSSGTTTATLDTATSLSYEFSDSDYKAGQNFFRKTFRLQLTIEATDEGGRSPRNEQPRDLSPLINRSPNTAPKHNSPVHHSPEHETTFNMPDLSDKGGQLKGRKKGKISVSQERTAAKTLGIIIGCFTVCWLPFFLITLIGPICKGSCVIPPLLKVFSTWLGYFNSALNPIIYTFFNPDFRKAFRRILSCDICR